MADSRITTRRMRYRFDNLMARGTPAMIGIIGLAMGVLIVLYVLLHIAADLVSGTGKGTLPLLWDGVLHSLGPGSMLVREDGPPWVRAVMVVLTVGGVLLVSLLVGVLGTGISQRLDLLCKGRSLVVESGHTVILGWSPHVFTVVSELVKANLNQRDACVVVLADRDKVEMDDAIRRRVPRTGPTRVVCRAGDPTDIRDVQITSPGTARSVIVLPPVGDGPDITVIKSLLAVTAGPLADIEDAPEREVPRLVAGIEDAHNLRAARIAGGSGALLINVHGFIARLLVQTALQSGLSTIYTQLLDFDGCEVYMADEPLLVGRTFDEAVGGYRSSSVIGLATHDGRVLLSPPGDTRIAPGDKVIAITEDDDTMVLAERPPRIDRAAIVAPGREAPRTARRILLLGWNDHAAEVVQQLDAYAPHGSTLDVVISGDGGTGTARKASGALQVLSPEWRQGDTTSRELLESLRLEAYDHVIVVSGDRTGSCDADSRTLITLLHLRDLAALNGHRHSVTTEMGDDRNRTLAQAAHADDFIVSGNLVSLCMAQVSENPRLNDVFEELFRPGGWSVALHRAASYVRTDTAVTFRTVAEAARLRGEVAIGYRLRREARTPPDFGIRLNPDRERAVRLSEEDQVVVLACADRP
ncbi:potassium transporter TrkA [Streptomyces sp. NPDC050504]|uniref:CASTOR/POLLUX-related putative ion channel n=1 Tax=Streptomyces sp. NPDC050504 TaxID=3365618 RepID=UPI0037ABCBE6